MIEVKNSMKDNVKKIDNSEVIRQGYYLAGENFLAFKLKRIFSFVSTPEEIALHNEMYNDIINIIDNDFSKDREIRKGIARILLLRKPVDKKQRFLKRLAQVILGIGAKNVKT